MPVWLLPEHSFPQGESNDGYFLYVHRGGGGGSCFVPGSGSNCTDLGSASYCARNVEYSDDPNGLQGMRYYCNKSCGFCGGFPRVKQDTSCVDISGTDYCESSKEDCQNPVFKYNMKNYCNKTCGYCTDESAPPPASTTSTPSGPAMPPGALPDGTDPPSSGPQPPMPPGA